MRPGSLRLCVLPGEKVRGVRVNRRKRPAAKKGLRYGGLAGLRCGGRLVEIGIRSLVRCLAVVAWE